MTTTSPISAAPISDIREDPAFGSRLDPASYLCLASACRDPSRTGLVRDRLSQRAAGRRHLSRLFPAGAGRQREPGRALPLHMDRLAPARNRARRPSLSGEFTSRGSRTGDSNPAPFALPFEAVAQATRRGGCDEDDRDHAGRDGEPDFALRRAEAAADPAGPRDSAGGQRRRLRPQAAFGHRPRRRRGHADQHRRAHRGRRRHDHDHRRLSAGAGTLRCTPISRPTRPSPCSRAASR